MARTLHLTTPLMHGEDVATLQAALVGAGWLKGQVDGIYGVHTAQAVYRTKFWLGYRKPDKVAGDAFLKFVRGEARPTLAMVARRKTRLAADRRKKHRGRGLTHGQRIVQRALSQLGQTESPPGSNRSKFSLWYGLIGPWCAMFVTWAYVMVGQGKRTFQRGSRYAYVPYVRHDAVAGRNGLMVAGGPADGVLACFDWQPDGTADHIGICAEEATLERLVPKHLKAAKVRFGPLGPGDFWSCEGNTGIGNDSNGGMVMLRKRRRSQAQTFVKVAA